MKAYFLLMPTVDQQGSIHCSSSGTQDDRAATFLNARHFPEGQSVANSAVALTSFNRIDSHISNSATCLLPVSKGEGMIFRLCLGEEPGVPGETALLHPQ